jgi:hypothetical protein
VLLYEVYVCIINVVAGESKKVALQSIEKNAVTASRESAESLCAA